MAFRRVFLVLGVGFTFVLAGYLMVWLPQPVAGLSLIGFEMGEWVKFLPEVQAGLLPDRNMFYLPPILLALMMIVWTAEWPNGRWQTWIVRGMAFLISFLAFPVLEIIRFEPSNQWLLRLAMIGLVGVTAVLGGFLSRLPQRALPILLLVLALLNLVLPTWVYLAMRPVIANLLRTEVGIGPGLALHIVGNLLIITAVALTLRQPHKAESLQTI